MGAELLGQPYMTVVLPAPMQASVIGQPVMSAALPLLTADTVGQPTIDSVLPLMASSVEQILRIDAVLHPLTVEGNLTRENYVNVALPKVAVDIFTTAIVCELDTEYSTLPAMKCRMEGGGVELAPTLPHIDATVTAIVGRVAELDLRLHAATASLDGETVNLGYIDATLLRPTASLHGVLGRSGSIDIRLPRIAASVIAKCGTAATLQATLPGVEAELHGYVESHSLVELPLHAMHASLDARRSAWH
jgi:hypothetical protein